MCVVEKTETVGRACGWPDRSFGVIQFPPQRTVIRNMEMADARSVEGASITEHSDAAIPPAQHSPSVTKDTLNGVPRPSEAAGTQDDGNSAAAAGRMLPEQPATSEPSRGPSGPTYPGHNAMASSSARSYAYVSSRTDTTLDSELARTTRQRMADATAVRQAAAAAIAQSNDDLRKRIAAIRERAETGAYAAGFLDHAPPVRLERDSQTWRASYLKFEVEQENQEAAQMERQKRGQLQLLKSQQRGEWLADAREKIHDHRRTHRRLRKVQEAVAKANRKKVQGVQRETARLEEQRQERDRIFHAAARARVIEASQLDDRLDRAEAAREAREREEGTRLRTEVARALVERRDEIYVEKRQLVEATLSARAAPVSARAPYFSPRRGQQKREQSKEWQRQRKENEDEYLARARAFREQAERQRESTKKSMLRLLKSRKKHAAKERANDVRVTERRIHDLERSRREVSAIYRARFATKDEVARMWSHVASQDEEGGEQDDLRADSGPASGATLEQIGLQVGDRIEVLLESSLIAPPQWVLARVEPLREGEATVGEADYTLWYNMDGVAPRRCRFSPLAEDIRVSESGEGGHFYDVTDGQWQEWRRPLPEAGMRDPYADASDRVVGVASRAQGTMRGGASDGYLIA